MRFRYQGIDPDGLPVAGEAVGEGAEEVTRRLGSEGIQATTVKPVEPRRRFLRGRVSGAEIAAFCEQLASLTDARLPLDKALASLARDAAKPALREALERVARGVEAGKDLDKLLEDERAVFPPLLPALVRAGQASGNLPEVLRLAAVHSWRMDILREEVIAAIAYPAIVLALLVVLVSSVFLYVVPQFTVMLDDMWIAVPPLTQALFTVSKYWAPILGVGCGIVGLLLVVFYGFDDLVPCLSLKRWVSFRLPLLGRVLRASYLFRFCRFMHLLLRTGMPLDRAVELLAELDRKTLAPRGAEVLADALKRGASLAEAMQIRLHMFPEMLVWSVSACEADGRLVDGFGEMADLYEREAVREMEVVRAVLPPVCILMVGGVLVLTVFGFFLPLSRVLTRLMFW